MTNAWPSFGDLFLHAVEKIVNDNAADVDEYAKEIVRIESTTKVSYGEYERYERPTVTVHYHNDFGGFRSLVLDMSLAEFIVYVALETKT